MSAPRPSLLKRLTSDKHVAGVDCIIAPDGTLSFTAVILSKKRNNIFISQKSDAGIDFERLALFLKKDIPVVMTLSGKGILHKKLPKGTDEEKIASIGTMLPGAKAEDFYLQLMHGYNDFQFFSIIRRTQLDEILDKFTSAGFWVVTGVIGPVLLQAILPFSDIDPNVGRELDLPAFSINILGDGIDSFGPPSEQRSEFELSIGDEKVGSGYVMAFSSAFSRFHGQELTFLSESIKKISDEFYQRKLFKGFGLCITGFMFAVLLFNYILFNKYSSGFKELDHKVTFNADLSRKVDSLRAQVSRKEAFLQSIGMLESSRLSYFADQLAYDFPSSLLLKEIQLNPVLKSSGFDEKKLDFRPRTLMVRGSCSQSTEVNAWIGRIKKKNWVKEVSLTDLSQDKLTERGEFSIEIAVR